MISSKDTKNVNGFNIRLSDYEYYLLQTLTDISKSLQNINDSLEVIAVDLATNNQR